MASESRSILADMRAQRRATFAALCETPEERFALQNEWRGARDSVRFFFLRFADHEEEHATQLAAILQELGFQQTRVQRHLGAAEATRGDLLAALTGLSDADLDLTPPGEWPLRRTLAHHIQTEYSYTRQVLHAASLHEAGQPWAPPEPVEQQTEDGDLASFTERIDAAREHVMSSLADLPDSALPAATVWAEREVDVNFRLMRFAHHEREHTAHIVKWRRQVGRELNEAQALLGLAWRARGVLESHLAGAPDDLLDQTSSSNEGTIRELLTHIMGSERYIRRQIARAT